MFKTVALTDTDKLRKAWTGWNSMNRLRSFMLFIGLLFSFLALNNIYSIRQQETSAELKQPLPVSEMK